MKNNNPPFVITGRMLAAAADIAEQVGRLSAADPLAANPTLRRSNRIRTIHGSLAIEQNTLSLEQVTAVLGGKHVLAPPKDIAEVKNAYEIYDRLDELDPYAVDDLLLAHGVMMRGLVEEAGVFRSRPVGVVDSEGRVGRLWHTMLLSRWNPAFAWLPVESIIHDRQQEYYDAINRSNSAGESTVFIEFMLSAIQAAVTEAVGAADGPGAERTELRARRWRLIAAHLQTHDTIRNADVQALCGVSPATANRILAGFTAEGKLQKLRVNGRWAYRRADS